MQRLYNEDGDPQYVSRETIDRVIRQVFSETGADLLGWKVNPDTGKVVKDGEDDFGCEALHDYLYTEMLTRE